MREQCSPKIKMITNARGNYNRQERTKKNRERRIRMKLVKKINTQSYLESDSVKLTPPFSSTVAVAM